MKQHTHKIIIYACLALCVIIGILLVKIDLHPPAIELAAPQRILGKESRLEIILKSGSTIDLRDVYIYAVQGEVREQLIPDEPKYSKYPSHRLTVHLDTLEKLQDGDFDIEVKARSSRGMISASIIFAPYWTLKSFPLKADFTPPSAQLALSPAAITRGGPALFTATVNKELRAAAFAEATGGTPGSTPIPQVAPKRYARLVALPQDYSGKKYLASLYLSDQVGNMASFDVRAEALDFVFRDDVIWISDRFLQNKEDEFRMLTGNTEAAPLELFLIMNRQEREKSYRRLKELCQESAPQKLWDGPFAPMPGAVRRSHFADRRAYVYKNEVIDRQVHLGLDYASVVKDNIPASNSGRVAFAGQLGIHGNAVLIDHGLSLFSLYSHLSEISAQEGEPVEKGQIIGRTGTTGMAGGDHLHFEILASGVSLNPDFFFDADWLEQNIDAPLARFLEAAAE